MRAFPYLLVIALAVWFLGCRRREQPPVPKTADPATSERQGVLAPKKQIDRAGQAARDAQKTFNADEAGR